MAVTFTIRSNVESSASGSAYSTSVWTPTNGSFYLLLIHGRNSTGTNPAISSITGNGITWTPVVSADVDATGGTDRATEFLYRAAPASGTSNGPCTVTFTASCVGAVIYILEVTGLDQGGTNGSNAIVQTAVSSNVSTASPLATLASAFGDAVNNVAFGFFGSSISTNMNGSGFTPGTGFTKIKEAPFSNPVFVATAYEYQVGQDLTVDGTFAASGRTGAIAVELKAATNSTQTVSPSGIASAQAFGTATVGRGAVSASPTGIASAEAFGTATVHNVQTVSPSGIASAAAFGTATVGRGPVTVSPTGIGSAFTSGTAAISRNVKPTGVASTEAFGTAAISRNVKPTGIASGEAFGTLKVSRNVKGTGIASAEAFGTLTIANASGPQSVSPTGIASAGAFGTAKVNLSVAPTGIASAQAFGSDTVTSRKTLSGTGIASAQAFGTATVGRGPVTASPTGIASAGAFGTATVSFGNVSQSVSPTGIPAPLNTVNIFGASDYFDFDTDPGSAWAANGTGASKTWDLSGFLRLTKGSGFPTLVSQRPVTGSFGCNTTSIQVEFVARVSYPNMQYETTVYSNVGSVTATWTPTDTDWHVYTMTLAFTGNAVRSVEVGHNQNLAPAGATLDLDYYRIYVSSDVFGTPTMEPTQIVSPSGIASGQAFGSDRIVVTAKPTGIASAAAVGTPTVSKRYTLSPSGVYAPETMIGVPTVTLKSQFITAQGIASRETFGTQPFVREQVYVLVLPSFSDKQRYPENFADLVGYSQGESITVNGKTYQGGYEYVINDPAERAALTAAGYTFEVRVQ